MKVLYVAAHFVQFAHECVMTRANEQLRSTLELTLGFTLLCCNQSLNAACELVNTVKHIEVGSRRVIDAVAAEEPPVIEPPRTVERLKICGNFSRVLQLCLTDRIVIRND